VRCGIIGEFFLGGGWIIWWLGCKLTFLFRITMHNASYDYQGLEPRHGTRVTSLAEKPVFEADAPTRRQALGLAGPDE
jgi:hypothetical protein